MAKLTLEDLRRMRGEKQQAMAMRESSGKDIQVVVGMGTCGIAAGAKETWFGRRAAWACAIPSRRSR